MKKYFLLLAMALTLGLVGCSDAGEEVQEDLWDTGEDIPAENVVINDGMNTLTISMGESYELSATLLPSTASVTSLLWETADASIATVSRGVVTGVTAGEVAISVSPSSDSSIRDTCMVTVRNAPIAAPAMEVAGGFEKGRVRWTPMTDSRIDKYEIYVDGVKEASLNPSSLTEVEAGTGSYYTDPTTGEVVEFTNKYYEYYMDPLELGSYDVSMICVPNNDDLGTMTDTLTMLVYEQSDIDSLAGLKIDYMAFTSATGVTEITWAATTDCKLVELSYTDNDGNLVEVEIVDFTATTYLQGTSAGTTLTYNCWFAPNAGYEAGESLIVTTIDVEDGYSRIQLLSKPFTGFDETGTTATHGYKLAGDAVVLSSYPLSAAHDGSNTLLTLDSGSSTNGLHTDAGCTGLAITLDLGGEYILTEFTYWQRRYSQIYGHVNPRAWRMWGASADALETDTESEDYGLIKEDYQQTVTISWVKYPDFDTMSEEGLWVLLCEEEGQIAPGSTTIATSADYDYYGVSGYGTETLTIPYGYTVSTGGASLTLNQLAALAGHVYYITEETPVQYIRMEFLESWNAGSNYGFAEMDLKGEALD